MLRSVRSSFAGVILMVTCGARADVVAPPAPDQVDRSSPVYPTALLLKNTEADLAELSLPASAAAARDAAVCGTNFDMDAVLASFVGGKLPAWAAPESDQVIIQSVGYYQCRAYALHDRAACAPLKALTLTYDAQSWTGDPDGGAHWDLGCYGHINEMSLVRSFVERLPDFSRQCAPTLTATQEFEDQDFANADIEKVCRIITEQGRDPDAACRRISRYYLEKEDARKCVPLLRRMQGDPGACRPDDKPEVADRCRSYAAFRRAYSKRDISLCGSYPICWVLMGAGPGHCSDYAGKFRGLFCEPRSERLSRIASALDKIDADLASSDKNARGASIIRARAAAARRQLARLPLSE